MKVKRKKAIIKDFNKEGVYLKKCIRLSLKLVSIFVAVSVIVGLIAVFRDEVVDFLSSLGITVREKGTRKNDEYADFDDV